MNLMKTSLASLARTSSTVSLTEDILTGHDSCCFSVASTSTTTSDWGCDNVEEMYGISSNAHKEILLVQCRAVLCNYKKSLKEARQDAYEAAERVCQYRERKQQQQFLFPKQKIMASSKTKKTVKVLTKKFLKRDDKVQFLAGNCKDMEDVVERLEEELRTPPFDYRLRMKEILSRKFSANKSDKVHTKRLSKAWHIPPPLPLLKREGSSSSFWGSCSISSSLLPNSYCYY